MPAKLTTKPHALDFTHPLKAPLERWLLLSSRLQEVEQALVLLVGHFSRVKKRGQNIDMPSEAMKLIRPLYCFAVVTYIRCFSGGRRHPLRITDVPRLTAHDLQTHEEVRKLRNNHFAHAVADEEGAHILAIPAQADQKAGFVVFDVVLAGRDAKDLRAFLTLVRKVQRFVRYKESQTGNGLAKAIFGPKASWASCLGNGALATNRDA